MLPPVDDDEAGAKFFVCEIKFKKKKSNFTICEGDRSGSIKKKTMSKIGKKERMIIINALRAENSKGAACRLVF